MSNNILELRAITKEYYQGTSVVEIVQDFSLNLKEKESIAITGESGSGKSTLLSIIGLLDNDYRGTVLINNRDVTKIKEREKNIIRNRDIGFIFQKYMLIPNITARENVALPRLIKGDNHRQALEDADTLISSLGLANKIFNMPGELSGGEQQRVAIARSLINNPKMILADEPTGNLDPENSKLVFDMLMKHIKERNTSLVIVTHNIEFANTVDRNIRLD